MIATPLFDLTLAVTGCWPACADQPPAAGEPALPPIDGAHLSLPTPHQALARRAARRVAAYRTTPADQPPAARDADTAPMPLYSSAPPRLRAGRWPVVCVLLVLAVGRVLTGRTT